MIPIELQILKDSQKSYKDLITKLASNCNTFEMTKDLEDFNDRFIQCYNAIEKMIKMNLLAIDNFKSGNKSLDLVIEDYKIDVLLNEEKAKKWLINALILVVMNKNTYNGLYFNDGLKNSLKHDIIKNG